MINNFLSIIIPKESTAHLCLRFVIDKGVNIALENKQILFYSIQYVIFRIPDPIGLQLFRYVRRIRIRNTEVNQKTSFQF